MAKLDLQLGHLDTAAGAMSDSAKELRALRREARNMPALVKVSSSFQLSTAAGATMCNQGGTGAGVLIGGPNVGEEWRVRQIVVGGATIGTAATGVVWFLVSAGTPNEQSITSVVASIPAMPAVAFYSNEQIYLAPNENLWMVVVGGTNNQNYVASVAYQANPFRPQRTVEDI